MGTSRLPLLPRRAGSTWRVDAAGRPARSSRSRPSFPGRRPSRLRARVDHRSRASQAPGGSQPMGPHQLGARSDVARTRDAGSAPTCQRSPQPPRPKYPPDGQKGSGSGAHRRPARHLAGARPHSGKEETGVWRGFGGLFQPYPRNCQICRSDSFRASVENNPQNPAKPSFEAQAARWGGQNAVA